MSRQSRRQTRRRRFPSGNPVEDNTFRKIELSFRRRGYAVVSIGGDAWRFSRPVDYEYDIEWVPDAESPA